MRGSKLKHLSSLFRSPNNTTSHNPLSNSTKSLPQTLETLKEITTPTSESTKKHSKKSHQFPPKATPRPKKLTASQSQALTSLSRESLSLISEESENEIFKTISSILGGGNGIVSESQESPATVLESQELPSLEVADDGKPVEKTLDIPWFSDTPQIYISHRRKEVSRERKQKWVFKNTQTRRFERLVTACGKKLGAETALEVFGKLGRETGLKEYSALIKLCVEGARTSEGEEDCLPHIHMAYHLLRSMRERGFQLEEKAYGRLLMYLIDMGMVEEFHFFCDVIKDKDYASISRLGYYEMLLWIRVGNDDKVQELCSSISVDNDNGYGRSHVAERYLLALCENDRKKEVLQLLEVVDITKISSLDCVSYIFQFLGRLMLESLAEKFILAFRTSEVEAEMISSFICNYAMSMPNLVVEDVISKFKNLHERLDVNPSSTSYEKLIIRCCDSLEVHAALDLVDQMCQLDLALSVEIFNPILHAVEGSCELDLVHPIYSVIRRHNLKPNCEIFRSLINFCVKIKDFEGAYNILTDLKNMDITPTANMYNAILAGFFREKNVSGALMVINQMKRADVKPDSQTYSYLIFNCENEDDINKYFEEWQHSGIQATKSLYMSLINAYVNCGLIEKAKQVVLDDGIPVKHINEVKSVLISALASCGQMSDALIVYEEIKQAGCNVEPKAIISLIECLQSEGELDRLLVLLGELEDPDFWFDGCGRIVSYCIRYKHLRSAVDLLKQLKDSDVVFTDAVLDQVFCQISEAEPNALDVGIDLLQAIKDELKFCPTRTSLDFLLSACLSAKDTIRARFIWAEYQKADLPYNVLTYLRMYQVLLASGDRKAARCMLKKVPKDDPHVRCILKACKETFNKSKSKKGKNKLNVCTRDPMAEQP